MVRKISERNTRTKQLVSHIFQSTPEPISLQDVYAYVKVFLPQTAHSTVFRIARRFLEDGTIHRVDLRERGSCYEWAGLPHHHHIVCQLCGQVTDLDDSDLKFDEKFIQKKTGYLTKHHSIELEGICPRCQLPKP